MAAAAGHNKVVQWLLKQPNINVTHANKNEQTALSIAIQQHNKHNNHALASCVAALKSYYQQHHLELPHTLTATD